MKKNDLYSNISVVTYNNPETRVVYGGSFTSNNPGSKWVEGQGFVGMRVQGYSFACNHNRDIHTTDVNLVIKFFKTKQNYFKKFGFDPKHIRIEQTINPHFGPSGYEFDYRVHYHWNFIDSKYVFAGISIEEVVDGHHKLTKRSLTFEELNNLINA